jgi:hypothetical protein
MAVKLKYLTSSVLIAIFLTSCASDPSEKFSFDYSTAKVSDFDGRWEGRVDCKYEGGKYKQLAQVDIQNGKGALAHYGDRDRHVNSELNLKNGKISWQGKWLRLGDQSTQDFSAKGQWMGNRFKLSGRRGTASCSGVLLASEQ